MRLAFVVLLLPALASAASLPAFLPLPNGVSGNEDGLTEEQWGEAEFPVNDGGEPPVKRGHHWSAALQFSGLEGDVSGKDVFAKIQPSLAKGGWTVAKAFDENPFSVTLHLAKGGRDAWAWFMIPAPDDIRLELVDVGPQPLKFSVPAPAATPEKVAKDHGDLPWLPPLPGSTAGEASFDPDETLLAPVPGEQEPQLVATGRMKRTYTRPATSNAQFNEVYAAALKAAGWDVLENSHGVHQSDGELLAHYTKNGRDLWAYLHHAGDEYLLSAADNGARDLSTELAKTCRVPLYGVLFDFNKATLRPESDAVLAQAAAALKANAKLAIEVQGHTDNVGGDEYNQKLSQARAESVRSWLVGHGIEAARLTARGYGRTRPVASNEDAEGRAKNRRVELSCRK